MIMVRRVPSMLGRLRATPALVYGNLAAHINCPSPSPKTESSAAPFLTTSDTLPTLPSFIPCRCCQTKRRGRWRCRVDWTLSSRSLLQSGRV